MKHLNLLVLLFPLFIFGSCTNDSPIIETGTGTTTGTNTGDNEWLIPSNEVRDGGPGKDGIPAIADPKFSSLSAIDFLDPNDLVIVVKNGEEIRAYPHPILDWHEIANDELSSDIQLSLTYCPLTGTAIGWNSVVNGIKTTFGVSGLLYNSNLMPYDRATDSYWSQMRHDCVKGELQGTIIETIHVVEMDFSTLQEMYPNAMVMNTNTGFNRNYNQYPYGDYRTNNNNLIFPVSNRDDRVPSKERVLGVVIDEEAITYRFESFDNQGVTIVQNRFQSTDLVVLGSKDKNFLTAYQSVLLDGTALTFTPIQNAFPIVMEDQEGNKWDLFGEAIEGPRKGQKLPEVLNYIGYWFSWATFNENLEIY